MSNALTLGPTTLVNTLNRVCSVSHTGAYISCVSDMSRSCIFLFKQHTSTTVAEDGYAIGHRFTWLFEFYAIASNAMG